MNNAHALRMSGYSADVDGNLVLRREGRESYQQEATALMRIDFAQDSKALHELATRIVGFADQPRGLVGRSARSVVLLFKAGVETIDLRYRGQTSPFEFALRTGERFTVSFHTEGALNISAYSWAKTRSPLEVRRDDLPTAYLDTFESVLESTLAVATWSSNVPTPEEAAAARARLDKVKANFKPETDDERQAREDAELSAKAGPNVSPSDGVWASLVIGARQRIAARSAARAADEQRKKDEQRRARLAQA